MGDCPSRASIEITFSLGATAPKRDLDNELLGDFEAVSRTAASSELRATSADTPAVRPKAAVNAARNTSSFIQSREPQVVAALR